MLTTTCANDSMCKLTVPDRTLPGKDMLILDPREVPSTGSALGLLMYKLNCCDISFRNFLYETLHGKCLCSWYIQVKEERLSTLLELCPKKAVSMILKPETKDSSPFKQNVPSLKGSHVKLKNHQYKDWCIRNILQSACRDTCLIYRIPLSNSDIWVTRTHPHFCTPLLE